MTVGETSHSSSNRHIPLTVGQAAEKRCLGNGWMEQHGSRTDRHGPCGLAPMGVLMRERAGCAWQEALGHVPELHTYSSWSGFSRAVS